MIFDLKRIISNLSQETTLEVGDVIATGRSSGVSYAMASPSLLSPAMLFDVKLRELGQSRIELVPLSAQLNLWPRYQAPLAAFSVRNATSVRAETTQCHPSQREPVADIQLRSASSKWTRSFNYSNAASLGDGTRMSGSDHKLSAFNLHKLQGCAQRFWPQGRAQPSNPKVGIAICWGQRERSERPEERRRGMPRQ